MSDHVKCTGHVCGITPGGQHSQEPPGGHGCGCAASQVAHSKPQGCTVNRVNPTCILNMEPDMCSVYTSELCRGTPPVFRCERTGRSVWHFWAGEDLEEHCGRLAQHHCLRPTSLGLECWGSAWRVLCREWNDFRTGFKSSGKKSEMTGKRSPVVDMSISRHICHAWS